MARAIDYLPNDAHRVVIFHNPTAGAHARTSRIIGVRNALESVGLDVRTVTVPAELPEVVGACQADLRAVVAGGGDGTVALVANQTPPETPIAVLPLGTENLLGKYVHASREPAAIVQQILTGATVRFDAGQANSKMFLLMAGCGFDADVVRRMHAARRGHIRHWSYIKPILGSLRSYDYPTLRVTCTNAAPDGAAAGAGPGRETHDSRTVNEVRWVFVVNLPRYAGGLNFVPTATGTDGLLDVCTLRHGSFWNIWRYLWGVSRGRHLRWPDVTHIRARTIEVAAAQPVAYQLDGDPGGELPVSFRVLPARLRLVVDPDRARQLGFGESSDLNQTP